MDAAGLPAIMVIVCDNGGGALFLSDVEGDENSGNVTNDPRFIARIEASLRSFEAGFGVRLEEVED